MDNDKPIMLPKKETVPLLTGGESEFLDCGCARVYDQGTVYNGKRMCLMCYRWARYPNLLDHEIPDDLYSALFDD